MLKLKQIWKFVSWPFVASYELGAEAIDTHPTGGTIREFAYITRFEVKNNRIQFRVPEAGIEVMNRKGETLIFGSDVPPQYHQACCNFGNDILAFFSGSRRSYMKPAIKAHYKAVKAKREETKAQEKEAKAVGKLHEVREQARSAEPGTPLTPPVSSERGSAIDVLTAPVPSPA